MKNNLLQIRLRKEDKEALQEAAQRQNMSLSEFVMRASVSEAREDNGHATEMMKRNPPKCPACKKRMIYELHPVDVPKGGWIDMFICRGCSKWWNINEELQGAVEL